MLSSKSAANRDDNYSIIVGDKRLKENTGIASYGRPSNNPFEAETSKLGLVNGVARFGRAVQLEFNKSLCNYGRLVRFERFDGTNYDEDYDNEASNIISNNHPDRRKPKSSYEMATLERAKMNLIAQQKAAKHSDKLKADRLVLLNTKERLASDGEKRWTEWSAKQIAELERLERAEWWRYSLRSSSQSQLLTTSFENNRQSCVNYNENYHNCLVGYQSDADDNGKIVKTKSALSKEMSRNSRSRRQACQDLLRYCRSSGHLWDKKVTNDDENDDDDDDDDDDIFENNEKEEYEEGNIEKAQNHQKSAISISNSAACLLQETTAIPHPIRITDSEFTSYDVSTKTHRDQKLHNLILPQPKVNTYLTKHALEEHMQKVAKDLVLLKKRIFSRHERLAIRQRQASQDQQDRINKYRKRREKLRQKIEVGSNSSSNSQHNGDGKSSSSWSSKNDYNENNRNNDNDNDNNEEDEGKNEDSSGVLHESPTDFGPEPDHKVPNPTRPKTQDRYVKALLTSISHKLANVNISNTRQNVSSIDQSNSVGNFDAKNHEARLSSKKNVSHIKTGTNIVCPCVGPVCAVNCPLNKDQKGHLELLSSLMNSLTVTKK